MAMKVFKELYNVKIGANSTVLKNIPNNVTVVRCNKIVDKYKKDTI